MTSKAKENILRTVFAFMGMPLNDMEDDDFENGNNEIKIRS